MARYFTREEAERLLSQVRPLLEEVQRRSLVLEQLQREVDSIERRLKGDGHLGEARELQQKQQALREVRQGIARMVAEVQDLGVEVKDLTTGLVDFRAVRDGREVYLCWRVGEPRVEWWHPLEGGFAGRQKLE